MPVENEKPQRLISCPRCGRAVAPEITPPNEASAKNNGAPAESPPATDSQTRSSSQIVRLWCPACRASLPPALYAPAGTSPPLSLHAPELQPGDIVGSYKILCRIGKGGMGTVYRAENTKSGRHAALKSLILSEDNPQHQEHTRRFLREARLAAAISHPNVVRVLGFIKKDDRYHIVQEYMSGGSLKALVLRKGKIDQKQVLEIARCAARALVEAAKVRIVHRDIKPDNIMLSEDGTTKLADLGLATQTHESDTPLNLTELAPETFGQADGGDWSASLTLSNMAMGTPAYMAPEQAVDSRTVDQRADFYSLGATLYHLLCGEPPFVSPNLRELLLMHRQAPVPDPRAKNPDVSPALARLVMKCLAKEPGDRFQTAEELAQQIEQIIASRTATSAQTSGKAAASAGRSTRGGARHSATNASSRSSAQLSPPTSPVRKGPGILQRMRADIRQTFTRDNIHFLLTVFFALVFMALLYLWSEARLEERAKNSVPDQAGERDNGDRSDFIPPVKPAPSRKR